MCDISLVVCAVLLVDTPIEALHTKLTTAPSKDIFWRWSRGLLDIVTFHLGGELLVE